MSIQVRLKKASPDYRPATDDPLGPAPARHELGRAGALQQILSDRTPAARLVGQSICRIAPLRPCAEARLPEFAR